MQKCVTVFFDNHEYIRASEFVEYLLLEKTATEKQMEAFIRISKPLD